MPTCSERHRSSWRRLSPASLPALMRTRLIRSEAASGCAHCRDRHSQFATFLFQPRCTSARCAPAFGSASPCKPQHAEYRSRMRTLPRADQSKVHACAGRCTWSAGAGVPELTCSSERTLVFSAVRTAAPRGLRPARTRFALFPAAPHVRECELRNLPSKSPCCSMPNSELISFEQGGRARALHRTTHGIVTRSAARSRPGMRER